MLSDDVLMGDFDGDGYGDLVRRRPDFVGSENYSRFAFYRGLGDGSFEALVRMNMGAPEDEPLRDASHRANVRMAVGDAVGDGVSDIFSRMLGVGMLTLSHSLTPPPSTSGIIPIFFGAWNPSVNGAHSFGADSDRLLIMDANQDGHADLVTRQEGTGKWYAYMREPFSGNFGPPQQLTFGGRATAFADTDVVLGAVQ